MADDFIPYQNPASVDGKLDAELLTIGINSVKRERVQLAGTRPNYRVANVVAPGDIMFTDPIYGSVLQITISGTWQGQIEFSDYDTEAPVPLMNMLNGAFEIATKKNGAWFYSSGQAFEGRLLLVATALTSGQADVYVSQLTGSPTPPRVKGFLSRCDYDGSGNLIYFGRAVQTALASETEWEIRKLTYDGSGNMTKIEWADADRSFDNVWDNRAALTYG